MIVINADTVVLNKPEYIQKCLDTVKPVGTGNPWDRTIFPVETGFPFETGFFSSYFNFLIFFIYFFFS